MPPILLKLAEIIINAGAAMGFFLGMILLTRKNKNRGANKFLAALLMVLSLSILHSVLAPTMLRESYSIREPFILFIGPLLYFYVLEVSGIKKFQRNDLFHFSPFVVVMLFFLSGFINNNSAYSQFFHGNDVLISKIIWLLIVFQFGYYWFYILALFRRHRIHVESEFSNLEGKTLTWLHFFLHVFAAFLVLLVLTVVIAFHTSHSDLIDSIVCFGLSMAIFALGHNGLFQETVFSSETNVNELDEIDENHVDAGKIFDNIQPDETNLEFQKLAAFLERTKSYLDESLTLTELANQVGMTRNQLSALINNSTGENFYSFINKYRVEEVKQKIADPSKMNFTILSLAYESGFSSKSAFQAIFKKFTGLTPTEYRNKLN